MAGRGSFFFALDGRCANLFVSSEGMPYHESAIVDPKERICSYDFWSMLKVAKKCLYDYLLSENGTPKPCLSRKGYLQLGHALLGVQPKLDHRSNKTLWSLDQARADHRLRTAGIDPGTWQIIDPKAACWAWHQLRTAKQYSPDRQATLMSSNEPPPDIRLELIPPRQSPQKLILEKQLAEKSPAGSWTDTAGHR
jgi:hypothetical protein